MERYSKEHSKFEISDQNNLLQSYDKLEHKQDFGSNQISRGVKKFTFFENFGKIFTLVV